MSRALTITFTLSGWSSKPSGGARIVYGYANRLAARGHRIRVVHAAFLHPRQYRHTRPGREWKNLVNGLRSVLGRRPAHIPWEPMHPNVELRFVSLLDRRSIGPGDVVVATAWRTAAPVAALPPDRGGRAYFLQHHETWDATDAAVNATWQLPMRKIVIAQWLYDLAESLGVDADTVIVPNAIDLERFRSLTPLTERGRTVAMMWSAAPIKGGDTGLAVLRRAQREVPDLRALLFGVGAPPRDLPEWAQYFRSPAGDVLVRDVYNAASVYLCPSRGEGWHLPPAEAMACGCGVVSTDIRGVEDYAIDRETALLAPVDDVEGLAEALTELLLNEPTLQDLASAGRRRIERFSWERSTDEFEAALRRAAV